MNKFNDWESFVNEICSRLEIVDEDRWLSAECIMLDISSVAPNVSKKVVVMDALVDSMLKSKNHNLDIPLIHKLLEMEDLYLRNLKCRLEIQSQGGFDQE